jgi:crossover junction endodeoxyribonuclease RuvC
VTTALSVGQARGVVLLAAAQAGLPVHEYKPAVVKQALVGYGAATKAQMQEMVRLLLGLAVAPHPDDAADAVAVAICHLHSQRLRQLIAGE